MSRAKPEVLRRKEPLRVGFLPVSDCAPIVYAQEAGLFSKHGLDVELRRETSLATIRDKVINGELDAAQAPATLPFLANLGLDSDPCACISAMVLSLQGNAITISRRLWDEGVYDAVTLREHIYRAWGRRTYTFGVVFPLSSQSFLLNRWFKAGGIRPEVEVRIVTIPPDQMFPTMKLGYLDGYCTGEPWTSIAVQAGSGVCLATSAELAPLHPEKLLMVRQSFSAGRAQEHEAMIAALLEACAFCDLPQNRPVLSEMISHPQYVNAPPESIRAGLVGPFELANSPPVAGFNLNIFHRFQANDPTDEKAAWIINGLYEMLEQKMAERRTFERAPVLKNIFRRDIFEQAKAFLADQSVQVRTEAESFVTQLGA